MQDCVAQVTTTHRMRTTEVIRQAYEYYNHQLTKAQLEKRVSEYTQHGRISQEVQGYCDAITTRKIIL